MMKIRAAILLFLLSGLAAAGQNGPNPQEASLFKAAGGGDVAQVQQLLAQGVNVDARDANGDTALLWAADKGQAAAAQLLIADGANINAKGDRDLTALILAQDEGHPAVTKLLKDHGAK